MRMEATERTIKEAMKDLDCFTGIPIFSSKKLDMIPGMRYLIVSYGGTGADALYAVKQELKKRLNPDDYNQNVRLLAVDSDRGSSMIATKKATEDEIRMVYTADRFSPREFLWLNPQEARQYMSMATPNISGWINPVLVMREQTRSPFFRENCATATRQLGRLLLASPRAVDDFQLRITELILDLTNNNSDNLQIIVISGISGGTGSGIVIDATYMIHACLQNMRSDVRNRFRITGVLFLPPTGTSSEPSWIEKGNKNGYACLKEIDYYMHIVQSGEVYESSLGYSRIQSHNNIFDACFLLDGNSDHIIRSQSREKAREVLASTILNLMTTNPTALSDLGAMANPFITAEISKMIGRLPERRAPRNANYIYGTFGYGSMLIPLELMKAHVAKGIFEKVYRWFYYNKSDSSEEGSMLLDRLMHEENMYQMRALLRDAIKTAFMKNGPCYAKELSRSLLNAVSDREIKLERMLFVIARDEKLSKLRLIRTEVQQIITGPIEIYLTVLDEMRQYLDQQGRILCNADEMANYLGFDTFCPVDFTSEDTKSIAVREYLDDLVHTCDIRGMINGLLKAMIENKEEWTNICGKENIERPSELSVTKRIRSFWQNEIEKIVDASTEDYLLKYYSSKKSAKYYSIADEQVLTAAARNIVAKMWGSAEVAKPAASLRTDIIQERDLVRRAVVVVPDSCPNLAKVLRIELHAMGIDDASVKIGNENDRIVFCESYAGLPAFMFDWTRQGERAYEKAITNGDIGIHLSETREGEQWINYPNLLIEDIWPMIAHDYYASREHTVNEKVRDLFNRAYSLGLAKRSGIRCSGIFGEYRVFTLQEECRPALALFRAHDNASAELAEKHAHAAKVSFDAEVLRYANQLFKLCDRNTLQNVEKQQIGRYHDENDGFVTIHDLLQKAWNNGDRWIGSEHPELLFQERELVACDTVLDLLIETGNPIPMHWEEKIAADLLRKNVHLMEEVRGTVEVLEALYKRICETQKPQE